MTGYALRHRATGGYLDVRDKGVVQHVDRIESARQFASTVAALVAVDVLDLDLDAYDVVQAPDVEPPPPGDLMASLFERLVK